MRWKKEKAGVRSETESALDRCDGGGGAAAAAAAAAADAAAAAAAA